MIIVAGHLRVEVSDRDAYLAQSRDAMELARRAPGCHDFIVAADPIERERINVFERWADRAALEAFRGDGPDDQLSALIVDAEIEEFEVQPSPPAT